MIQELFGQTLMSHSFGPLVLLVIPDPGDLHSGIVRLGQRGNQRPNGNHYEREDVQRMMRELWEEFVAKNPDMFKT